MISLRRLQASDSDLADLAAQLNAADSEVTHKSFTAESLQKFLADPNNFYLIALDNRQLAGMIHGYKLLHPTGIAYLYIDEVDTVKEFRRQGVARTMMQESLKIAKELGCTEAWLGTEHDNEPAKALYESLVPDEVENGPIYTWKVK